MPQANKDIKRRIKSIANTKKITKAMELVAAAKMRKAVKSVLSTREYSNLAWQIIKNLAAKTDPAHHPLLQRKKVVNGIAVVMLASNRGLCGGFNREIVEQVAKYCQEQKSGKQDLNIEIFLMGKRGSAIAHRYNYKLVADFPKADVAESVVEVADLSKMIISEYLTGKFDKVVIAYTDYKSAIKQVPRIKKLLPISKEDDELGHVEDRGKQTKKQELDPSASAGSLRDFEYVFEPSPDVVLDQMIYRLIELQIYQALLESNASEHSARMMAMRNASDAAGDMIDDLTLAYNQARQQSITAELADISAGRAAVE